MRRIMFPIGFFFSFIAAAMISGAADPDVVGRWDLTVGIGQGQERYPSWLEVTRKNGKLEGRFVGREGSVRSVSQIAFEKGRLSFSVPPQYEKTRAPLQFIGSLSRSGNQLRGKVGGLVENPQPWVGVRSPLLPRNPSPKWGAPVVLFNGKDLAGWRLRQPGAANGWKVTDGILVNNLPSTDLISERKFRDFRLDVEFKIAPKSNSGVYLRGRYEVQIQDDAGKPPGSLLMGGVYGFLTPSRNAARPAGEWQSYAITLLGRHVTVVLNGDTVIDNQEIPGITGGALDSMEEESGPIMIQGDHGTVSFRNVVLTPTAN